MDNLLEKCKLSNFNESTVKMFLENNPKAVAVHPRVDKNGNTFNNGANADIRPSFGEGDEDFLGFGITIIPLSKLHESNGIYLCKDSKEGDELYSVWCKLPSTIDRQKRVLEKKISDYKKLVLELEEKLATF